MKIIEVDSIFPLNIRNKQGIEIKPDHGEYRCGPSVTDILSARIDSSSEHPNLRTKGSNQRAEKIELIVIRRNRGHSDTLIATEQTTSAKHIIPWLEKRNLNIRTAPNKNSTVQNNKSEQDAEISKRWFSNVRNSCSTPSIYLQNSNLCFLLQTRSEESQLRAVTATHNLHITTGLMPKKLVLPF